MRKEAEPKEEENFEGLSSPRLDGTKDFEIVSKRKERHSSRTGGTIITLSNSTTTNAAAIGDTIGTLAVLGGVGSYTFTFFLNPGTLFSIAGATLKVASSPLAIGLDSIVIEADNGAGSVIFQSFIITVRSGTYVPTYELLGF